jgi:hypothetical protein
MELAEQLHADPRPRYRDGRLVESRPGTNTDHRLGLFEDAATAA